MSIKSFIVRNLLRITPGTTAGTAAGELRVDSSSSNKLKYHNGTTEDSVVMQTALDTANQNLTDHLNDTTAAHAASAIAVTPAGNLAATDAQGALTELQGDVDGINTTLSSKVDEIAGTDNAIVRSNGTSGAIQDSDIQIDDSGNLLPEADATQNLGSSTKRFQNLFVDTVTNDNDPLYIGDPALTPTVVVDALTTVSIGTGNTNRTVNIGTGSGTNTVNIGGANTTVNITGTVTNESVTNLNVTDKLVTINDGGGAASAGGAGIEVEENATITGYIKLSSDRGDWEFKVPDAAGVISLTPGSGSDSVVLAAASQTLTNKTFDADGTGNSISNIENADIKVGAAIARSKLAVGSTNRLVINDASTGAMTDAAAITASRALASDADGIPVASATTATELGYVSGVSSAIQAQLNAKAPSASPTFSGTVTTPLTASRALVTGASSELAAATTTATEIGYVNGVTSAIQTQLDAKVAKSTYSAKGSLLAATAASTPANVSVGADGTFLKADSGSSTGVSWASAAGTALSYRSATTTDSPTSSDDIVALSGASFTVTLPTAASISGKILRFMHLGTSLTQVYTFNTTSSQTIGGIASGSYKLFTNGEVLTIVSDGSNWQIVDHHAETAWTNAGTITFSATTTGPTKGSTQTIDKFWWRRAGQNAHVRINFRQTNGSGGNAGSGDLLVNVATYLGNIDTAALDVYATVEGWNSTYQNSFSIGNATAHDGTSDFSGEVIPYDATYVRLSGQIAASQAGFLGSAFPAFTGTNVTVNADFIVPITSWQP